MGVSFCGKILCVKSQGRSLTNQKWPLQLTRPDQNYAQIPAVVVVMSTYNGEKYLTEQIDSILAQKNVRVELFIRDDGSKDSTRNISYQITLDVMTMYTLTSAKISGQHEASFMR